MSKYRKTFQIPFYDSDKEGRVTPFAILSYLGETSGEHTDHIGFGYNRLIKLNYAWMLNRWKVKIDRYPKVKEKIVIETWTSKIDRFYANREFLIYDENNEELRRASTLWIFIDMDKKRPIRIPEDFIKVANPVEKRLFDEFYEFERSYKTEEDISFKIRRSDIDYNNHVNNTKYLSWILESIPENIYETYSLSEFEIQYKKEIPYANNILSGSIQIKGENNDIRFIHSIDNEKKSINHALAWTKWIKKEVR